MPAPPHVLELMRRYSALGRLLPQQGDEIDLAGELEDDPEKYRMILAEMQKVREEIEREFAKAAQEHQGK